VGGEPQSRRRRTACYHKIFSRAKLSPITSLSRPPTPTTETLHNPQKPTSKMQLSEETKVGLFALVFLGKVDDG
jgi:hypothetical protein